MVTLIQTERSQARPDRLTVEALAGRSNPESVQGAPEHKTDEEKRHERAHPESHGGGSTGHPAAIRQTEEEYRAVKWTDGKAHGLGR